MGEDPPSKSEENTNQEQEYKPSAPERVYQVSYLAKKDTDKLQTMLSAQKEKENSDQLKKLRPAEQYRAQGIKVLSRQSVHTIQQGLR